MIENREGRYVAQEQGNRSLQEAGNLLHFQRRYALSLESIPFKVEKLACIKLGWGVRFVPSV
jgi:hypothetical protein